MIDLERTKTISVKEFVSAAEKTWEQMPIVQVMLRDKLYTTLVSLLATNLGLIDPPAEETETKEET